jgi:hypothetical protein
VMQCWGKCFGEHTSMQSQGNAGLQVGSVND